MFARNRMINCATGRFFGEIHNCPEDEKSSRNELY